MADTETVPQGHNMPDLGFALAHLAGNNVADNNAPRISSVAIYRSRYTPVGVAANDQLSYLASNSLIADQWGEPVVVSGPKHVELLPECFAYVLIGNTKYRFTVINHRVNIRSGIDQIWTNYQTINHIEVEGINLAATTIGPDNQILVYCWSNTVVNNGNQRRLIQLSAPTDGTLWESAEVPGNYNLLTNLRLAAVTIGNQVYLIYKLDTAGICLRCRDANGNWDEGAIVSPPEPQVGMLPNVGILAATPIAIMAIRPPVVEQLLPEYRNPADIPFPPGNPLKFIEPWFPDARRFAITYIDEHHTVQVIKVNLGGEMVSELERVGRLNTGAQGRFVQSLGIAPGIHPRSVIVYGISSMHQTPTLMAFSKIASPSITRHAVISRELYVQAAREYGERLQDMNNLAVLLETATTAVGDPLNPAYIQNVSNRNYAELRYLFAVEECRKSSSATAIARNLAINTRNILMTASLVSRMETVRTEARSLDPADVPVFPLPI